MGAPKITTMKFTVEVELVTYDNGRKDVLTVKGKFSRRHGSPVRPLWSSGNLQIDSTGLYYTPIALDFSEQREKVQEDAKEPSIDLSRKKVPL